MTKLIQGFTDIIQPMNLAVNGSFRINQRGLFYSTTVLKSGDYVVDTWKNSASTNLDLVKCLWGNNSAKGMTQLYFSGYGKKGQKLILENVLDYKSITRDLTSQYGARNLTAACDINYASGVPVTLNVTPISVASSSKPYQKDVTVYSGISYKTAVGIFSNSLTNFVEPPKISVTLEQDGEFYFVLENFRQFSGLFKHPPQSQTPYDIDLLRCKRYYQSGKCVLESVGGDSGIYYTLGLRHTFEVEMAGIPTITINNASVSEEGSTSDVSANYTIQSSTPNSKDVEFLVSKTNTGSKPRNFIIDWTAEV